MIPQTFTDYRPQVGQGMQELLALLAAKQSYLAGGDLLASAARTATASVSGPTNYNFRGVMLSLIITAASGTGGLSVRPYGRALSLTGATWITSFPTAIVATGTYNYQIYPGATFSGATNTCWPIVLPMYWGVSVNHGDASSYTYSLEYHWLP